METTIISTGEFTGFSFSINSPIPITLIKGSFGNPSSMPRDLRKLQLWESHSSFARVLQEIFPKASTIQPSADLQILSFPCWKRYSEITYPNWILSNLHWKYCMRLKLFVKSGKNWLLMSILPVWWRKHHFSVLEPWKSLIWTQITNMCPNLLPFHLVCWDQPFKTKQEDYINWISPKRIIAASSECWLRLAAFACCDVIGRISLMLLMEGWCWDSGSSNGIAWDGIHHLSETVEMGKFRGIQDPVREKCTPGCYRNWRSSLCQAARFLAKKNGFLWVLHRYGQQTVLVLVVLLLVVLLLLLLLLR